MYCGKPSPLSIRSFSLACAMSRPTILCAVQRQRRVDTSSDGCLVSRSWKLVRSAHRLALSRLARRLWNSVTGLRSSFSDQILRLIFALMFRSAEQDTPTYRTRCPVARQSDDTNIVSEIFAAELRAPKPNFALKATILFPAQYRGRKPAVFIAFGW